MSETLSVAAHLQIPMLRPARELIERAAQAAGQSVDEFAAGAVIEKAEEVLGRAPVRCLSAVDANRFLELLDATVPNDALLAAARRFPSHE